MNKKDRLQFLRFCMALYACAFSLFIMALITKMVILTIFGWITLIGGLTIRYWYIPKKDRERKEKKKAKYNLVEVKSSEVLSTGDQLKMYWNKFEDQLKIYWDKFIYWLNN